MVREIAVPGDKSISHRALIFAALAEGESRISSLLVSADTSSTAAVLRTLGVPLPELSDEMIVSGVGLRGLRKAASDLDCGNSGTTARLICGMAAALPFSSRFTGDASLSKRPMRRLAKPLEEMGARFEFANSDGLPLVVHGGPLRDYEFVNETASAQIKSALLLAGLLSSATVTVREPRMSRDHTENMLRATGAALAVERGSCTIRPGGILSAFELSVPRDPSSAAFLAARAALTPGMSLRFPRVCLNPTRTGFLAVLRRMGAEVSLVEADERELGEIVGDIVVTGANLRATQVLADEVPALLDELPLVACLAARAEGETRVTGAGELRLKESDRISTVVTNLRTLGVDAEELPDGFIVRGAGGPLGGRVQTHGDHRIAMAFAVLGAASGNGIQVDNPGCVSISYPGFWAELRALGEE
jgi:3-phosphoshikimate 1-carboxyvinyltransferase